MSAPIMPHSPAREEWAQLRADIEALELPEAEYLCEELAGLQANAGSIYGKESGVVEMLRHLRTILEQGFYLTA